MNILISIDGGEAAEMVLTEAKKFIRNIPDIQVHVFNVMDMSAMAMGQGYDNTLLMGAMQRQSDDLKKMTATLLGDIPFEFSTEMGFPTDEILKKAANLHSDLLIMGTHGRTGLDHLLIGSVAEKVLRLSNCNTLVIPVKKK